jgi:hypothetical protein
MKISKQEIIPIIDIIFKLLPLSEFIKLTPNIIINETKYIILIKSKLLEDFFNEFPADSR